MSGAGSHAMLRVYCWNKMRGCRGKSGRGAGWLGRICDSLCPTLEVKIGIAWGKSPVGLIGNREIASDYEAALREPWLPD